MNIIISSRNKEEYLLIEAKGSLKTKDDLFMHTQSIYLEISKHNIQKILIAQPELHLPSGLFQYYELVMHYIDDFPPDIRFFKNSNCCII